MISLYFIIKAKINPEPIKPIVFIDCLPTDSCYMADLTNTNIAHQIREINGEARIPLPFNKSYKPEHVREWLQNNMPDYLVMLGQPAASIPGRVHGIDFFA